jgi:hypothetical protein
MTAPHSVPDPHDHDDGAGAAVEDVHEPDAGYVILEGGAPFCFDDLLVVGREER